MLAASSARAGKRCLRQGETRPGLLDIGARHFADIESFLRGTQLFLQNLNVLLPQRDDPAIAPHIHIGLCRVEEHLLLGRQQILAAGLHAGLRLLDTFNRLEAPEDRLR